jgi:hypothetical protein
MTPYWRYNKELGNKIRDKHTKTQSWARTKIIFDSTLVKIRTLSFFSERFYTIVFYKIESGKNHKILSMRERDGLPLYRLSPLTPP